MDEEIKEEILDSPLIVHKVTDASYQETANENDIQKTHTDDDNGDEPTLERHRFRKEKKKSKAPYIIIALVMIVAVIIGITVGKNAIAEKPEDTTSTKKSYTTQPVNEYENTITLKGLYIFFEGVELDGYEALERKVKYMEPHTRLTIQDEHADSNFLNFEVLSLLAKYEIDYDIVHIQSSGLKSKYETTVSSTKKKKSTKKKSKETKPTAVSETE